ncbi:MAG TPA: hypothetical protein VN745_01265 [Verrucomicrobiae bacterium]|nr:hypothetical protein [Verrucomicrobiae bacterium]
MLLTAAIFACSAGAIAHAQHSDTAAPKRTAPLFSFHSNFWINLHQCLVHEALLKLGKPDRRLQSSVPLAATGMNDKEESAWKNAVSFYTSRFGVRQELFDDEMVRINNSLAQQGDDGSSLNATDIPAEVAAVLRNAAPVYRKYWWAGHDRENKNWIGSQLARVNELGAQIAAAMEKDLRQSWPAASIRVDVCYYVPEIGHAYTTTDPAHTTFSSSAPSLEGLSGFETLFHEASHSFSDKMSDALSAECSAQKKQCGDLWHAVLFYTPGVEVRRALPSDEPTFTPYAYKYGLYTRGEWPKYRAVLEKDWQPYLDGKTDFASAIHAMAADLR